MRRSSLYKPFISTRYITNYRKQAPKIHPEHVEKRQLHSQTSNCIACQFCDALSSGSLTSQCESPNTRTIGQPRHVALLDLPALTPLPLHSGLTGSGVDGLGVAVFRLPYPYAPLSKLALQPYENNDTAP